MKINQYFHLEEFVPPTIFKRWQEKSVWFISPIIMNIADQLRAGIGKPVIINNWADGGPYEFRGFRPPNCKVGATLSQHRLGNAIDISVVGLTEKEVFAYLLKETEKFRALGLTTIENPDFTPGWLHLDCRPKAIGSQFSIFTIVNP